MQTIGRPASVILHAFVPSYCSRSAHTQLFVFGVYTSSPCATECHCERTHLAQKRARPTLWLHTHTHKHTNVQAARSVSLLPETLRQGRLAVSIAADAEGFFLRLLGGPVGSSDVRAHVRSLLQRGNATLVQVCLHWSAAFWRMAGTPARALGAAAGGGPGAGAATPGKLMQDTTGELTWRRCEATGELPRARSGHTCTVRRIWRQRALTRF